VTMYITLKASSENKSNMKRAFTPLSSFFDVVMEELPVVVEDTVANIIESVFEYEGSRYGWESLRPYTQMERARLGYGAEHPILVREGTYRDSFIDPNSPHYVSDLELIGEGSYVQRIGTTNPLFPWHEKGTQPPHNMPARPATPIGDDAILEDIVTALNEYLTSLLEDMRHG